MSKATSAMIMQDIDQNGRLSLRDGFVRDLCTRRAVPLSAGIAYAEAVLEMQGRILTDADAAKLRALAEDIDEPELRDMPRGAQELARRCLGR